MEERPEFKLVSSARERFSDLRGRNFSIVDRILARFGEQLLSFLEEIFGKSFYIEFAAGEDSGGIKFDTKKLASDLTRDGFLKSISFNETLPDEPKGIYAYSNFGELIYESDGNTEQYRAKNGFSGTDFLSRDKAVRRCLGEAVERNCLGFYKKENILYGSFEEFSDRAVNPKTFTAFSENQLRSEKFANCRFNDATRFGWVRGESLTGGEKKLVPAQLVYLTHREKEPVIRIPISTGAAAYTDREEAIYRGLCEAVERDAWMIFWLNKISPPLLDIEKIEDLEIQKVLESFRRARIEVYIMDFTTDIPIPTYGALLIDRTGVGPAVVITTKTDLDSRETLLGALAEAYKSWWVRRRRMAKNPDLEDIRKRALKLSSMEERSMLWSSPDMIPHIDFLIKGLKKPFLPTPAPISPSKRLAKALEFFKKNHSEVVAVDIAIPEARRSGFYCFMALVPELQPLYLNESYRYWGGRRLYEVPVRLGYFDKPKKEEELNPITHPYV